jgi:hypothetical protein
MNPAHTAFSITKMPLIAWLSLDSSSSELAFIFLQPHRQFCSPSVVDVVVVD